MCCFSGKVERVSATRIFARLREASQQFVIYSMALKTSSDVAMILPIPVKPGTGEEGVKFISLEDYPEVFDDLESGFPRPAPRGRTGTRALGDMAPPKSALRVVSVGKFEASFVPTVADFSRLDERFKLPAGTWEKLGDYGKFGFAVFKLKSGEQKVHPMAFEFPTASSRRLFFPTVHVHDGVVHGTATFDHTLYAQFDHLDEKAHRMRWDESPTLAKTFVRVEKSSGIVNEKEHCYKLVMRGRLKNVDTIV